MTPVDYFKLQAKNLFRDFKTQYAYQVDADGTKHYTYKPKYFDMDSIFLDFEDFDEEDFSLMKAQHLLATMLGFKKWPDLLNASEVELELAKLRFDNQDRISLDEWAEGVTEIEAENNFTFDAQGRLDYFKHGLSVPGGHGLFDKDYRLSPAQRRAYNEPPRPAPKADPGPQITSLPLSKADHAEFVKAANGVFEAVVKRVEPNNPAQTRKLWDAEDYVNNMLTDDMLPISKDYALSLIDAFLVHHVIGLAVEADKRA
jgi:hypothetical protein